MHIINFSRHLAAVAIFAISQLLFSGCASLTEKPIAPPTLREQQAMTPEETEAAIRTLEKQLEEEKGEKATWQLLSLVTLFYCFQ